MTVLAAVRAVHFAACMLLFGELAFAYAMPGKRTARARVVAWSVVVALVSALAWLAIEAAVMSGEASAAWQSAVIGRVLMDTQFGHAWTVHVVLALLAAMASRALLASNLAATGMLAALAWMGHAGAAIGSQRPGELAADVVHIVAAAAWLGMLPALAAALRGAHDSPGAAATTQRFSGLATAAVLAVLLTGIVNTRLRVGEIDALFTTTYGRVLLAKVSLVAAMLFVAALNRWRWMPALARDEPHAARRLRRNAWVEIALGAVVVALVGWLGITAPGATGGAASMHHG